MSDNEREYEIGDSLAASAPEQPVTATLADFIQQREDVDVEFNEADLEAVKGLAVGECTAIGWSIIHRTA
ncbi:hypothetical protein CMI37_06745 [Candidatus Pacearchaeota archaeon]|nr:hypothetical protein [Candidatus Pacearchaeota archaeon]